jgi:hypothetical protein
MAQFGVFQNLKKSPIDISHPPINLKFGGASIGHCHYAIGPCAHFHDPAGMMHPYPGGVNLLAHRDSLN